MPEEQAPLPLQPANLEDEPLKLNKDSIDEAYALALVNDTFSQWETYRSMNHDRRWSTHDSLFCGFVVPRTWEGTSTPRSSLTQPIVFDQVMSALPSIYNSLFGVGPEWFQVEAEPGTSVQEAQQLQDAMSYVLEHPRDELGSNCVNDFKLAIQSTLLYGNGGVCTEYDPVLERPCVSWTDIRDIYVDPGLTSPSLERGRATISRRFMTIDEVLGLSSDPRMKIPPRAVLVYMARRASQAFAEQTKRTQEALRGVYYSPGFSDYTSLPSDQRIEVLVYTSKSRIVWVFNREWVAFNGPNPYNFIPYDFAPCYVYLSRFYAQSIADVQEQNQRYIEALMNNHLDEVNLALHPPRVVKRSSLLTPAQQRWRPGQVILAEDAKDVSLLQSQSVLTNVFEDIQYLTMVSEKRTGINAMGQGSVPQPSNANRTLGGLQMQAGGSSNRLSDIVANIEQYLLVPVLYKIYKLMQFHTRPGQVLPATSPQGEQYTVDASVLQKKVRFRMHAASKMVTRDKLMQVLPFWMQVLSQGNLIGGLNQLGQTIDFGQFFKLIQDATGVNQIYELVRPMNEQEQQAMNRPDPKTQADMQKAQMDAQTRTQLMQLKNQGAIQVEQVKKQPDQFAQQMEQQKAAMDMQKQQAEIAADAQAQKQKLIFDQMFNMAKLQAKKQEHAMDLQKKQADVQVSAQASENQRQQAMLDHAVKMQTLMSGLQGERVQAQERENIANEFPKGSGQETPTAEGTKKPNEKRPTKQAQNRHKEK